MLVGCASESADTCSDADQRRGVPGCAGSTPNEPNYLDDAPSPSGKDDDEHDELPYVAPHGDYGGACDEPWVDYAEWAGVSEGPAPCTASVRECLVGCRGGALACQVDCLFKGTFACRSCLGYAQTACPYQNGCGAAAMDFECCAEAECGGTEDATCMERACGDEVDAVRACVGDPAITGACADWGNAHYDQCF